MRAGVLVAVLAAKGVAHRLPLGRVVVPVPGRAMPLVASPAAAQVELTRWMGVDAVTTLLLSKMRDATRADCEKGIQLLEGGRAVPTRLTRKEQARPPPPEASTSASAAAAAPTTTAVAMEIDEPTNVGSARTQGHCVQTALAALGVAHRPAAHGNPAETACAALYTPPG